MTFDSVLFDLDGTLWDASSTCAMAWTETLKTLGWGDRIVSAPQVRAFTGLPFETLLPRFFPWIPPELYPELVKVYRGHESRLVQKSGGILYEGVQAGLSRLAVSKRLFIISNCLEGYIENFLAKNNLGEVFEGFECFGRTGKSKADNIALVVQTYQLRSPVYVGDTAHDAEAAQQNRIPFLFAKYGFGQVESPQFADSFTEAVGLLSQSLTMTRPFEFG